MIEKIVSLIHIDNIKNDTLILFAVVDSEIKPPSIAWIACVRSKA